MKQLLLEMYSTTGIVVQILCLFLKAKMSEKIKFENKSYPFKCQQKLLIFAHCALCCVEMASLGYDKQFRAARTHHEFLFICKITN